MNFETQQQSLLTFRVGPVLCCAPSFPVRSIITPPKLTHPPGTDPSSPGIFKHGSHIVKVLDLRQKFGIEQSEQTQPGNLIITVFEEESFAFWVDQILDVFDFPSEGWGALPAAIPRGVFSRTLLLNKKIHLYSEFEKLATINDLGYLKHYIQQLKKQQEEKETEQHQSTSTLKSSSHVKTNEVVLKPNTETKNVQTKKEDQPKHIEQKISKTSSLAKTPRVAVSKNTTSVKEVKEVKEVKTTPVIQPLVNTSITKAPTPTPTQRKIKNKTYNKKPEVIIEKKSIITKQPFSSSTSIPTTEDEPSSFGIIFFFILILATLGAGIYYLFISTVASNNDDDKYVLEKTNINTHSQIDYSIKETHRLEEPNLENNTSLQDEITSNAEVLITDTSAEKDNKPFNNDNKDDVDELLPKQKLPEKNENNSVTNDVEETTYRADIIQQDNDIIITLHQPISEEKPAQDEVAIIPQQPDENEVNEKLVETSAVNELKKDELEQNIKPEKIITEVIHTVVKGDTLWAIAKKYVNDPFLYPELARLSNIKNPHRIYPGNRVRIRFIKK